MNILHTIFPFLTWIWELKNKKTVKKDIIAGISVAFILVPQSMAYASLAGLPLQVWLYTACIPPIIAWLFGNSKQMSTGPVTIISLMTATALAPIASSGTEGYIFFASLLALFIWVFYLVLSFLRLWVLVNFLSHPLIIGFTNGVALITIVSQLGKIFGTSVEKSNIITTLYNLGISIVSETHLVTFIFGLGSIICLLLMDKFFPKSPKVLIVLVSSILISYMIWYHENYAGKIVMDIPNSLPTINTELFLIESYLSYYKEIWNLLLFAVVIGLIGFTETVSVAKAAAYENKQRVFANKELYGQWLANIGSALFGGYWVAGSLSKTAVAMKNGAVTGFSSIVTWLVVGLTIIFFTPYIYHLPFATLAAIIIVAVVHLIKFSPLIKAWHVEKHDAIVGMATFIFTLLLSPNIEYAIYIWVVASIGLFIYRSMKARVVELAKYKDGYLRDISLFAIKPNNLLSIFRFDGYLYFANCTAFENAILQALNEKKELKYLILDLEWMNDIDASGLEMIETLILRIEKLDIKIFFSGFRPKVIKKLVHTQAIKLIKDEYRFHTIDDAIDYIVKKYKKKIDVDDIESFTPEKNKEPDLAKKVLKEFKD